MSDKKTIIDESSDSNETRIVIARAVLNAMSFHRITHDISCGDTAEIALPNKDSCIMSRHF